MDISALALQTQFLKRRESFLGNASSGEPNAALERVRNVLSLSPEDRSDAQVASIETLTKGLKFFCELRENLGENAHVQCCRFMTFLSIPGGKCVFREGELGSQFYIILSGSCAVLTETRKSGGSLDFQLLTVLRAGDSFGELALISKRPRAATIFCREVSCFAVLDRTEYSEILKQTQEKQLRVKTQLLHQHPAFVSWSSDAISQFANFFQARNIKRKQSVFNVAQPATEVFLIEEGSFQVTKSLTQSVLSTNFTRAARKQLEITTVCPGDILGAPCALQGITYDCSCTCVSGIGRVFAIDSKNFKRFVVDSDAARILFEMEQRHESPHKRYSKSQVSGSLNISGNLNRSYVLRPHASDEKPLDRSIQVAPRPLHRTVITKSFQRMHRRNPSVPNQDFPTSLKLIRHKRTATITAVIGEEAETIGEGIEEKVRKLPQIQATTMTQIARKPGKRFTSLSRNSSLPNVILAEKLAV